VWAFAAPGDFTANSGTSTPPTPSAAMIGPTLFPSASQTTVPSTMAANFAQQLMYYNIHTSTNGGGEIRGNMYQNTWRFTADLNSAQQVSPSVSEMGRGVGWVNVVAPNGGNPPSITFWAYWWGLTGDLSAMHFHGPAFMGYNGQVMFSILNYVQPAVGNAMFGWIPMTTMQLTSVAAGNTGMQQFMWFISGQVYFNLHTSLHGGGELRGQVIMQQSAAVPTTASYVMNGDCKLRSSNSLYERSCIKWSSSGMSTMYHGWFSDAQCSKITSAYTMDATVHNAGVSQFLQRNNNNLDQFVIYPWNVTYATTSSADASTYSGCNTCAGATLSAYHPFTVRRSCGANAVNCPLLGAAYLNGLTTSSSISLSQSATTTAAWTTAGTTYSDATYSVYGAGACTDFIATFPSGAAAVVPSMLMVLLAALVAMLAH
jgi:hypothetical protein